MSSLACITEGCGKFAKVRGLCHNHYFQLLADIKANRITWEKALATGRCQAAKQRVSPWGLFRHRSKK